MRENLVEIATRLRDLGCPDPVVELHLSKVERWRRSHPVRIKRKRLYDYDGPPPLSAGRTNRTNAQR